jgi:hypothetical protein
MLYDVAPDTAPQLRVALLDAMFVVVSDAGALHEVLDIVVVKELANENPVEQFAFTCQLYVVPAINPETLAVAEVYVPSVVYVVAPESLYCTV